MPVWAAKCSKPYYERRTYFPAGAGYFISRTLGHKAGQTTENRPSETNRRKKTALSGRYVPRSNQGVLST